MSNMMKDCNTTLQIKHQREDVLKCPSSPQIIIRNVQCDKGAYKGWGRKPQTKEIITRSPFCLVSCLDFGLSLERTKEKES